jgi:hypothetical protein
MFHCQRCNLPVFDGLASYAGPQCKCWATYHPAPHAAAHPGQCWPAVPLTETDVRRIIREELAKVAAPGVGAA